MRIGLAHWIRSLLFFAAATWSVSPAHALQVLSSVELAQPIVVDGEVAAASDDLGVSEVAVASTAPSGRHVEIVKERYPSGAIKIEREMVQDAQGNFVLHGMWRGFDEKGRLVIEGQYDRGQRSGAWRRFYMAGEVQLLTTVPYREFSAPFLSQVTFDNGVLQGKWIISDSKQRIASEIDFADGQRHGKATWYYPSGTLFSEASYDQGAVDGDVAQWTPDGTAIAHETYQHGSKLAVKTQYYGPNQKQSETTVLYALLAIKTPDDWFAGTLATFETRGLNEKHGPFLAWHPNGQLARQGEFHHDLPQGKITYWFPTGQKEMEGYYVDGKPAGTWTWWHENGQRAIAGQYEHGSATGRWSWWKENGAIAKRADLTQQRMTDRLASPKYHSDVELEARTRKERQELQRR